MSGEPRVRRTPRSPVRSLLLSPVEDGAFGWGQACARGILIFLFFVVATVLVPSWLARAELTADLPGAVLDSIVVTSWFLLLGFGMWGLRRLQREKRI